MRPFSATAREDVSSDSKAQILNGLKAIVAGIMLPFSFAPFRLPGLAILGLSLLYGILINTPKKPFKLGFVFGLGFFGVAVSWVLISIHEYGHLNYALAGLITCGFIAYLSLFTGLFAYGFCKIKSTKTFINVPLFAACWVIVEYLRSTLFTGFPWALIGYAQIDSPIKEILPFLGVYGASFITALSSAFIAEALFATQKKQKVLMLLSVFCVLGPKLLSPLTWTTPVDKPLSVGVIQANLSMRDKWDETLFWTILEKYQKKTEALLGSDLIVFPESAIPLPWHYVSDYLLHLQTLTQNKNTTLLLGIPELVSDEEGRFYNTLLSLGHKPGVYHKQHLVPFGEYIPQIFKPIVKALNIPDALLKPGEPKAPIWVNNHPIAALICYELAYGALLQQQLPLGQMIVSISDDGWFGHSLAIYQHLQMAQALSLAANRDQILANNDGLSALINHKGELLDHLPAFKSGVLKTHITPRTGATPWVMWGDWPILFLSLSIFIVGVWLNIQKRHMSP